MKRKLIIISSVMATTLLMQSVSYANVSDLENMAMLDYSTEKTEIAVDEVVLPVENVEEDTSSVDTYATSTDNFMDITLVAPNGTKYTLVANISYSYAKDSNTVYATGVKITNIKDDSKNAVIDIVIPESIITENGTLPVIAIGEAAFDNSYAKSITVPSSVYEINDRAFTNCPNLTDITIKGTDDTPMYSVGDAEAGETVKFYEIPTVIGDSVVANCPNLVNANINGFKTIGSSLFENCTSLKNVDIHINGFNVKTTGEYNSTARVAQISDRTFYGCSALENFRVMEGIKSFGKQTFVGCKALKKVEIAKDYTANFTYDDFIVPNPTSVSDLIEAENTDAANGNTATYDALVNSETSTFDLTSCTALQEFVVDADNKNLSSADGILYNKNGSTLYYVPLSTSVKNFALPESVTTVSDYSFYRNDAVKNFSAEGTKSLAIGQYACYKSGIEIADLNRTTKITLNVGAFRDCDSLKTLNTHYNHGGTMNNYAFYDCDSLSDLILMGWNSIGVQAFSRCDSLNTVTAFAGVGTINDRCFEKCKNLISADLKDVGRGLVSNASYKFNTYVFSDCEKLQEVTLPDGLLGISSGTFNNCVSLVTVNCANDVAVINSLAFNNCPALKNISDIRYLVKLDKNAFVGCHSLEKFTLTRSVLIFANDIFVDCPKLTLYTPAGFDGETYAQANGINFVHIADDISDYEFLCYYPVTFDSSGNRKVSTTKLYTSTDLLEAGEKPSDNWTVGGYRGGFRTLTIPNDDTCLSTYMHDNWLTKCLGTNCSMKPYLTSISMGGVEHIGKSAFASSVVENLILSPTAKTIAASAFANSKVLKGDVEANSLQLPLTMESIDEKAFENCISIEKVDTDFALINSGETSTDFKIGKLAFSGCTALKEFNTIFLDYDVKNAETGENVSVKYYLKEIGENAFKNCSALERVYFNGNLEKIGVKAFENCTALTAVTLDNSVLVQTNAFLGCTNLVGAIIVGEANVAVSNDPFCSNDDLRIVTTDASKAQTYVDFKNEGKGESDAKFTIELREFNTINGKAYLKSSVEAPADVVVYKNGAKMDTANEYVVFTNELTFELKNADPDKSYSFYVNGILVEEKYVVSEIEPEKLVVTYVENDKLQKGDVDGNGEINATDAAWALQHTLNPVVLNLDENAIARANVDSKNPGVDAADAAMILQKALNSAYTFE